MRTPVNTPYTISTEFGVRDSYALFGYHSGVDYALPSGRQVLAPVSGQLTNVVSPTGGNMVVIKDGQGFTHRLMHNSSFSRGNGPVTEGQEVAKSGSTGLSTGPHVHWDINRQGTYPTSFASFVSPADWLAGKFNVAPSVPQGGNTVFQNDAEVQDAYKLLRGNPGTAAERAGWIGQSKQRFFQVALAEANSRRAYTSSVEKQLADVKTALAKLQNQPPKEVVKIVEKVVEKVVEKPVDKIVYTHDEETKNFVKAIYNYFYTRYKTFRDSLGKDK